MLRSDGISAWRRSTLTRICAVMVGSPSSSCFFDLYGLPGWTWCVFSSCCSMAQGGGRRSGLLGHAQRTHLQATRSATWSHGTRFWRSARVSLAVTPLSITKLLHSSPRGSGNVLDVVSSGIQGNFLARVHLVLGIGFHPDRPCGRHRLRCCDTLRGTGIGGQPVCLGDRCAPAFPGRQLRIWVWFRRIADSAEFVRITFPTFCSALYTTPSRRSITTTCAPRLVLEQARPVDRAVERKKMITAKYCSGSISAHQLQADAADHWVDKVVVQGPGGSDRITINFQASLTHELPPGSPTAPAPLATTPALARTGAGLAPEAGFALDQRPSQQQLPRGSGAQLPSARPDARWWVSGLDDEADLVRIASMAAMVDQAYLVLDPLLGLGRTALAGS